MPTALPAIARELAEQACIAGVARRSMCARGRMARRWRGSTAARSRPSASWRSGCTSTGWCAGRTACICGSLAAPTDKLLDPGKLDHIVAGGVPGRPRSGGDPGEGGRRGGRDPARTGRRRRVHVGTIGYAMERPEGLRRDLLHCYDLELPERFRPARRPTARWRRSNCGRSRACRRNGARHRRLQVQRQPGADRPVPPAGTDRRPRRNRRVSSESHRPGGKSDPPAEVPTRSSHRHGPACRGQAGKGRAIANSLIVGCRPRTPRCRSHAWPRVDQPSGGAAAIGISRASGWSPMPGVRWSIR